MWPGWFPQTMPSGVLRAQGSAGPVRLYVIVRGEKNSDWSSGHSFYVRVDYTSSGSAAPSFSDLAGYKYGAAVLEPAALGAVGGYQDGRFGPNDPVKRAQFAKMIALTMHLLVNENLTSPFTDLGVDDPTDLCPHEYVAAVAQAGITTGITSTTFSPWNNIGLAQLVTMIVRAAQYQLAPVPAGYTPPFPNFDATHYPYARIAAYHGLFGGGAGRHPLTGPVLMARAKATGACAVDPGQMALCTSAGALVLDRRTRRGQAAAVILTALSRHLHPPGGQTGVPRARFRMTLRRHGRAGHAGGGHAGGKDAGSARSGATGATEDDASRGPVPAVAAKASL